MLAPSIAGARHRRVTFGAPAGLAWTLIRTEFKSRYHGTIGGFLWALLKPFAMFVVLLSVFSFIFASDPVYELNLIMGLFIWDFFAESTKTGVVSMHSRGYLLSKAKFPSWIVVVTSVSNALLTLACFTVVIFVFLALTRGAPTVEEMALYFTYVLAMVLITVGISLAGSVLFLRYRDLNQVWEVMIQAGFFLAPVVYPLSIIPWRFQFYLYLWPPTPIIQFSRAVLVDHSPPTFKAHVLLFVMTATIFGTGLTIFRRLAPRAAEHL